MESSDTLSEGEDPVTVSVKQHEHLLAVLHLLTAQRKQVRALMDIEKDEEILISYRNKEEFRFGSREFRRQQLLEMCGFHCQCSECSLEGEALRENELMRAEIREKEAKIPQLLKCEGSNPVPKREMKKAMKLSNEKVELIKKLNLRDSFVREMVEFYLAATLAREREISAPDPDIFKHEALKYAKMFGDIYIYYYNKNARDSE